jgi:hypothetical protein
LLEAARGVDSPRAAKEEPQGMLICRAEIMSGKEGGSSTRMDGQGLTQEAHVGKKLTGQLDTMNWAMEVYHGTGTRRSRRTKKRF